MELNFKMEKFYEDEDDELSILNPNNGDLTGVQTSHGNGDDFAMKEVSDAGDGVNKDDNGDKHFVIKVRGLPWSAAPDDLINFFEECNIKNGKEGTHFLMTSQGRPSGEAYVEFETEEDAAKALKKDKQYMGKRYVEVYDSHYSDMTYDMKRNAPRSGTDADRCILKLRGLPFSCTKEEISQFFTGLEIVPNGIVLIQDASGRATGEGFVRFENSGLASKAMEKHKERIGHRYVEIFPSSVRELEVATGVCPPPPSLFARGPPYGPPYGGYHDMPPHHYRPGPYDRAPPPSYRGNRMKGYNDYYGGYSDPYHAPYGDPYGQHHPPPYGGPQYAPNGPGFGGPPGYGRGPGGYGGPPPAAHRVRMRGLPYSATQQDIYEFFHPMIPANVHFIYLPNGKFSGEVDAEFRTHEEANDALRFDRKYIDKRYIELFLYSQPSGSSSNSRGSVAAERGGSDRGGLPPALGPPHLSASRSPNAGGYAGGYQTF